MGTDDKVRSDSIPFPARFSACHLERSEGPTGILLQFPKAEKERLITSYSLWVFRCVQDD